jgi:RNA polymerase sigma-70 factor (ECF subfamily)
MGAEEPSEAHAAGSDPLIPLLLAVATADQTAFAELYRLTSPKLTGVAMRLMRSRDQAEELLQDTYIRVWHKARLYDPQRGAPMVWLIAVLRRCALDRLRETARRRQREVVIDEPGLDAPELTVEFDPQAAGDERRIRRCLQLLDDSKRRAIELAFYFGLTHEELSRRMDVPIGTVKSWIRRGLKSLKDCLGDD